MTFSYRVPSSDYGQEIYLNEVDAEAGEAEDTVLALTVDQGDEVLTIRISDYGVRELRLALARYERGRQ